MAIYGGFAPGTYQGWALNLLSDIFGTPGIARGLQVTAPGGMTVNVTLNGGTADGVCFLPNGAFLRIDSQQSFGVPNNTSGGTRTDAIVAFVDPSGQSSPAFSLTYQTNWSGGFAGASNNQFVIALVSVANNASNITSGNITMNSATAGLGTGGGGGTSMVASDGVGLTVQDNSATSQLTVVLTGITTGLGRSIALAAQDKSGNDHYFIVNPDGSLTVPDAGWLNGIHNARVAIGNVSNGTGDIHLAAGSGNWIYFDGTNGASSHVDANGVFVGNVSGQAAVASQAQFVLVGGPGGTQQRLFTGSSQPTNATNGDIWIAA